MKHVTILLITFISSIILTSCSTEDEGVSLSRAQALLDGTWQEVWFKQESFTKEGKLIQKIELQLNDRGESRTFDKEEGKMHYASNSYLYYSLKEKDGKIIIETRETHNNAIVQEMQILSITETKMRVRIESPIALEGVTISIHDYIKK